MYIGLITKDGAVEIAAHLLFECRKWKTSVHQFIKKYHSSLKPCIISILCKHEDSLFNENKFIKDFKKPVNYFFFCFNSVTRESP